MSDRTLPGVHRQTPRSRVRWWVWVLLAVVVVAVISLAIGLTSSKGRSAGGSDAADKYRQTWTQSYSDTTCREWFGEMTADQRFAAAADILASARNKIDGASGLPPDSLIDEFADGLDNVCVMDSMTITDAAFGLYSTEPRFHP